MGEGTIVIGERCLRGVEGKGCGENVEGPSSSSSSSSSSSFWPHLARAYGCSRIFRRGIVPPSSSHRVTGHTLLYLSPSLLPPPSPPGLVTIVEHGIAQSYDAERVMFSRGNVGEKGRFGGMVREGEEVLDMYAGIGYYTLPALVIGKAKMVCCCEWNPEAVKWLRVNLRGNGVDPDRYEIREGDCRVSLRDVRGRFDRVSLGLIPSSEGGWGTAVRAVRYPQGGWIHVHANVREGEVRKWTDWMEVVVGDFARGVQQAEEEKEGEKRGRKGRGGARVNRPIQKVKSFAPRVGHYVADVFVGEVAVAVAGAAGEEEEEEEEEVERRRRIIREDPPTCALGNGEGAIKEGWMR